MYFLELMFALLLVYLVPFEDTWDPRNIIATYNQRASKLLGAKTSQPIAIYVGLIILPILIAYFILSLFTGGFGLLFRFIIETILLVFCLTAHKINRRLITGRFENSDSPYHSLISANTFLYPTLLVFMGLGPILTLAYEITHILFLESKSDQLNPLEKLAHTIILCVQWPLVRMTCFIFALMGDFNKTFSILKQHATQNIYFNAEFNQQMAQSILKETPDESTGHLARSIFIRTLISMLTLYAIFIFEFGIR